MAIVGDGFSDEFYPDTDDDNAYHLAFSDGTLLTVLYDGDGFWRITPMVHGTAEYTKHEATDADEDYTDVVTLTGDICWVVGGTDLAKAPKTERRR